MQEAALNFYHMGPRDERNLDHFYSLNYLASQELSLFSLGAIVALFSLAAENVELSQMGIFFDLQEMYMMNKRFEKRNK